jgi:hypothetical protein
MGSDFEKESTLVIASEATPGAPLEKEGGLTSHPPPWVRFLWRPPAAT